MTHAEAPSQPKPNPRPPSADEASRILNEAFQDPDWGTLVWLAMTTGARRGELCALRWRDVDLDAGVLNIRASIAQNSSKKWEKLTKTHQQRRIALDTETVNLLHEHRLRCEDVAASFGVKVGRDAFLFSLDPGSEQ